MSTATRKLRKRAGVKFERTEKVGTPFEERAWNFDSFPGVPGTKRATQIVPRSLKKRLQAMRDRGLDTSALEPNEDGEAES